MSRTIFALVAATILCVSSVQAQNFSRRNPVVEAVNKTRESVVTLKVTRETESGKKEVVGTGVVVDERGYVVTNYHVIADAVRIVAYLSDKTAVEAMVHATISKQDLAILRIEGKASLKAMAISSSADLMVGETVIAVGSPYGYTNTVSTGIVSALGREIPGPKGESLKGLIQHSSSINPGNSGGPLLNINGELIGINVAMREGAQNIAFAINAETLKQALATRLSAQRVSRVSHGLKVSENVKEEGETRQTVQVSEEVEGLQKGDVLVKMGSVNTQNRFDVERACWGYKAGEKVTAVVVREGKSTTVEVTLREVSGTQLTSAAGQK